MKVAISGHRPEKIPDKQFVRESLARAFAITEASEVTQGCAAGVDLISARVSWICGIPFRAAKPWGNHKARMGGSSGFRISDAEAYDWMIKNASEVVNVTGVEEYPGPWAYFKRNEWMVDNTDCLIAVWDGSKSGTEHTVKYAKSQGKRIFRIDPVTENMGWYGEQEALLPF